MPVEFPKEGVTFSVFKRFIEKCGGKEALAKKRTEEVNSEYLVPFTKESKLSYCNYLKRTEKENHGVGPAVVFISHAWKFLFLDVVNALENHFAHEIANEDSVDSNFYIWFDMFSNNQQFSNNELDFQWWTGTFKSAIEQFHHTVIILSPWNNPIPFTRAWCLYEIYCSILTGSKFEVALSQKEHSSLIDTLLTDFSSIEAMLATINCEKSECFKPEDRLNIFDAVRSTEGFDTINNLVFKQMQAWILKTLEHELSSMNSEVLREHKQNELDAPQGDLIKQVRLHALIGRVYLLQGLYEKCKDFFLKGIEIIGKYFKHDFYEVDRLHLEMNYYLGEVYYKLQLFNKASAILNDLLLQAPLFTSSSLSKEDLSLKVLIIILQVNLLLQHNQIQKAINLLLDQLPIATERLGDGHAVTIQVRGMIGRCYYQLMTYDAAEAEFSLCLSAIMKHNYSNYLFVIPLKFHYGLLLYQRENYEAAYEVFEGCYRSMKVRMGEHHPSTLTYLRYVYTVQLKREQKKEDREKVFVQLKSLLPIFEETFGESGSETKELLLLIVEEIPEWDQTPLFAFDPTAYHTKLDQTSDNGRKLISIFREKLQQRAAMVKLIKSEEEEGGGDEEKEREVADEPLDSPVNIERLIRCVFKLAEHYFQKDQIQEASPLYELLIILLDHISTIDFDLGADIVAWSTIKSKLTAFDPKYHFLYFTKFRASRLQGKRPNDEIDQSILQKATDIIDNHFNQQSFTIAPSVTYGTMKVILAIKTLCYQLSA